MNKAVKRKQTMVKVRPETMILLRELKEKTHKPFTWILSEAIEGLERKIAAETLERQQTNGTEPKPNPNGVTA